MFYYEIQQMSFIAPFFYATQIINLKLIFEVSVNHDEVEGLSANGGILIHLGNYFSIVNFFNFPHTVYFLFSLFLYQLHINKQTRDTLLEIKISLLGEIG